MLKKVLLFCLVIGLIQAHPASKFKKFQDVDRQLQEEEIGASLDRDFVSPHKNDRFNKFFQLYEEEKMGAKAKRTCGYQGCPKLDPNKLNVHLVAHSHDDVGWLKTVDQYYYGSRTNIQKAGVQYIIDSVIQSLLRDPKKRFIYVEAEFFHKWWIEQTPELQEEVKMLVNEGRLEFIGGAWSMNDEATVHYQSVIDQFTWGLKFLNDTFGECARPRVGWQIDPFGHSREQASMFAQMGFDGLFFGRLDYQDKDKRLLTKTPEMIWHGSPNLGKESDLFTGVLYNGYSPPPGFCFDILCADEPIINDPKSPDYNVNRRVDEYVEYIQKQSVYYRTNNIVLTQGGDFTFMDAHYYYKNLDKLIAHINARPDSQINIFYSTPSCYLKSLHDSDVTWPTKSDDFFPYGSDEHTYWTGYYTSRPTLKRFERMGNHFLQVCKQLTSIAKVQEKGFDRNLKSLREVMGIMQHHDAVTGTEKQHVAEDYARLLAKAFKACGVNTKSSLSQLTTGKLPEKRGLEFDSCLHLNISMCEISEKKNQFIVTAYNTLAHSTHQYVRVPVQNSKYQVKDFKGIVVPSQMVPIAESVLDIQHRVSDATFELVFMATEVPPLGYKSYYVSKEFNEIDPQVIQFDDPTAIPRKEEIVIGNERVSLKFHENGFIDYITVDGEPHKFQQEFHWYEGNIANNYEAKNRTSGAYIFRPKVNSTSEIISSQADIKVYRGELVDEVHQIFNEWVSQVIRVYKNEGHVEFEWMVGPIPFEDGKSREIVSRYHSLINSDKVFYTDSNGREMIKRVRNHRDTWNVTLLEEVAGNYFPINTKLTIEDDENRMSVLIDRAQGGSSLDDGVIELMIHRRLLKDDAFGVGEALNETAFGTGLIARGKHYVVFGKKDKPSPNLVAQERFLQNEVLVPVWLFFSDASGLSFDDWANKYNNIYSSITHSLPKNVYLMSLEPWNKDSVLVRFEHIFELNEDPEYSKPVTFNFGDVFRGYDIGNIKEVNLAGNQWIEDVNRLQFRPDPPLPGTDHTENPTQFEKFVYALRGKAGKLTRDSSVTLNPMEIRTFVVTLNQ